MRPIQMFCEKIPCIVASFLLTELTDNLKYLNLTVQFSEPFGDFSRENKSIHIPKCVS